MDKLLDKVLNVLMVVIAAVAAFLGIIVIISILSGKSECACRGYVLVDGPLKTVCVKSDTVLSE